MSPRDGRALDGGAKRQASSDDERMMRLYRGMTKRYDSAKVAGGRFDGTDFTDCPATALRYAQGGRGILLVLDIHEDSISPSQVTEELWLGPKSKRFMVWGKFDAWLVATIAAKELRAHLRERRLRNGTDEDKAVVLAAFIDRRLRAEKRAARAVSPPE